MKIAYIDCISGISGDMTLAALIDSGVPFDYLEREVKKLGLSHYSINVSKTIKNHIEATRINIKFDEKKQPDRKYKSIVSLITNSNLSDNVKNDALKAFKILGDAEAKIHGKSIEEIHFHEVGAVDSLVDVVGSLIGFDYLDLDMVYTSPIPLGTGFTKTDHGTMPVPAPAALEVLKDYPVVHKDAKFELTTPTGATIVKTLSTGILPEKSVFIPRKIGYGAGSKDVKMWPNVLRLIIGDTVDESRGDDLTMIETNIDDLNPEIFPYLSQLMFDAGANDVFLTPVIMKKGRPGTQVSVLTEEILIEKIENILFTETTTIGLRKYRVNRNVLERKSEKVNIKFGEIMVKKINVQGKVIIRPEYEACQKLAKEKGLNLQDIYREIDALNA